MISFAATNFHRISPSRVRRLLSAVLAPLMVALPNVAFSQAASGRPQPVTLDVVVTDSARRHVQGLRRQDFQILEDGKKQRISSFLAPREQASPEVRAISPLPPNTFTNADAFPPHSIEIVLLDQMNTSAEDQERALRVLRDFFTHKPPTAAFAIFTLRSDDPACSPFSYAQSQFGITASSSASGLDWSCLDRGRLLMIQGITQDKERLLAALDDNLARPHSTWMRSYPGLPRGGPPTVGLPVMRVPDDLAPPEVSDTSTSALADLGKILRNLPGRKGLIWISDSFDAEPVAQYFGAYLLDRFTNWEKTSPLSSTQLLHLAADRLSQDRVAIYPVNLFREDKRVEIKFLCPLPPTYDPLDDLVAVLNAPPTPITKQTMRQECNTEFITLKSLASLTGGKVFSGKDAIQNAIAQAVSDDSNDYVFVYSPSKKKFDGKVRKIRVKLTGKDMKSYKLAYRRTYFADDPSAIYPKHQNEQDVYVTVSDAWPPLRVVQVSDLKLPRPQGGISALWASLQYGAPESNRVAFTVHIAPAGPFQMADPTQMQMLQDYPSFIADRVQKAVDVLSKRKYWRHKRIATLRTLPPSDPVSLQPYSIEYALAPGQLTLTPSHSGSQVVYLEIAVIAYDASGKRVTGLKVTIQKEIPAVDLSRFEASAFRYRQIIRIPARVTVLRFAVCNVSTSRCGSLEVPVRAITSPYRRHQLSLAGR